MSKDRFCLICLSKIRKTKKRGLYCDKCIATMYTSPHKKRPRTEGRTYNKKVKSI